VLPDFGGATIASPTGEHSLEAAIFADLSYRLCCMQCRKVI
jgi:hypothetical protein